MVKTQVVENEKKDTKKKKKSSRSHKKENTIAKFFRTHPNTRRLTIGLGAASLIYGGYKLAKSGRLDEAEMPATESVHSEL